MEGFLVFKLVGKFGEVGKPFLEGFGGEGLLSHKKGGLGIF